MGRQMITVKHEDESVGTAVVPETALKFMPGWTKVEDADTGDVDGSDAGSSTPAAKGGSAPKEKK